MARKTLAQLQKDIDDTVYTNTTGAITAQGLNNVLSDIADSTFLNTPASIGPHFLGIYQNESDLPPAVNGYQAIVIGSTESYYHVVANAWVKLADVTTVHDHYVGKYVTPESLASANPTGPQGSIALVGSTSYQWYEYDGSWKIVPMVTISDISSRTDTHTEQLGQLETSLNSVSQKANQNEQDVGGKADSINLSSNNASKTITAQLFSGVTKVSEKTLDISAMFSTGGGVNGATHVLHVDHGYTGTSDGTLSKPFSSLQDAVTHAISEGEIAIWVTGIGDIQGVVDFSGLTHDLVILADFSVATGNWSFEGSFAHTVYIRSEKYSVVSNKPDAVKYIATAEGSTNIDQHIDATSEVTHNFTVSHSERLELTNCNTVVGYSSGFSGGRFIFPTNQMLFHSSDKLAIYHLLGISSDAEWDAITDVIKLPILPENHPFEVNGKTCYVALHNVHGSGQYQFKMFRPEQDITKADIDAFLNQNYTATTGELHNGNAHVQGDARIDGQIINPILEYNIHSLGEIGTEVAVACDSLHSVASGEIYVPQFINPEIDEDGNLVGGVFIAPYTGGYHFDVSVTSNHVILGDKSYHLKLKREKPDGTVEQLHNPKITTDVYSYTLKTQAGQNIYFNTSGPIILDIDDKLIVEFSHEAEQDLSIGLLLQVDSHNASNLTLKKLDKRLKYLEDRLELNEYKILVVNENGDISTKDKPVS